MDGEIRQRPIESPLLESDTFIIQKNELTDAMKDAQKKVDYYLAHDPEIRKAIDVVESFLRKSGRPCYGGQAINAHLPKKHKFYETEYDLPDYDFFSPNAEKDTIDIIEMLKNEGFNDIDERIGVHEGTKKIYVNYIAVADITYLSPYLYKRMSENNITIGGIKYVSPDILRMMMYLELSRPRGEVGRWEKVFERLTLLNYAKPIHLCQTEKIKIPPIESDLRESILQYLILKRRVFVGPELGYVYKEATQEDSYTNWILRSGGCVIFFSPKLDTDTESLKNILGDKGLGIEWIEGYQDIIPRRVLIRKDKKPVAYLIDESACSSYFDLELKNSDTLRIASLDTCCYTYLMLGLLTDDHIVLDTPLKCLAERFVRFSTRLRSNPDSRFPSFATNCAGHQKTIVEILREKAERVKAKREQQEKENKRTRKAKKLKLKPKLKHKQKQGIKLKTKKKPSK